MRKRFCIEADVDAKTEITTVSEFREALEGVGFKNVVIVIARVHDGVAQQEHTKE